VKPWDTNPEHPSPVGTTEPCRKYPAPQAQSKQAQIHPSAMFPVCTRAPPYPLPPKTPLTRTEILSNLHLIYNLQDNPAGNPAPKTRKFP